MANFREEYSKKFKTVGRLKELTKELKAIKKMKRDQKLADKNLTKVIEGKVRGNRRRLLR